MSTENLQPWRWLWRDGCRFVVLAESACAGVLVAFTVAWMIQIYGPSDKAIATPGIAAILGGIGGAGTGFLFSGWYGRPGKTGWMFSTLSALLAPSLAGAIGGTCLLPGPGTLLGAHLSLWTFLYPESVFLWTVCLVVIHLHIRHLRAGRSEAVRTGSN